MLKELWFERDQFYTRCHSFWNLIVYFYRRERKKCCARLLMEQWCKANFHLPFPLFNCGWIEQLEISIYFPLNLCKSSLSRKLRVHLKSLKPSFFHINLKVRDHKASRILKVPQFPVWLISLFILMLPTLWKTRLWHFPTLTS